MKLLTEFNKFNFFRRPDWRWLRVLKMADRYPTPGRASKRDDKWVKAARNFLLRWRSKETDEEREDLWLEQPGLFYAYDLFARQPSEPEGAMFLEARLLARQTPEYIAECMGTIPDTIRWYEALFFNVSDKLHQRDWITARVLLPALMKNHDHSGSKYDEDIALPFKDSIVARPFLDASLKLFAYFGGVHIIDVMITGFQQGKPLASPEDMANWFDNHMSTTVRRRVSQAAMQFEINKYNITELLTVHTRIMEIERSEESQDQQKTTTERHIKAMVDEIPWAVGDHGEKMAEGTLLGRLDKMPGELRDDEVLRISSGQTVPGLADDFPTKLPPARSKPSKLLGLKEDEL
jgi:hypothetical protein